MISVGIIGCGYWGRNYVRLFDELNRAELIRCADANRATLAAIKQRHPLVDTSASFDEILTDDRIRAVVVCTPASTHYSVASQCLEAGKSVLVEKPITTSSADAEKLSELAKAKGLTLMVGHTFLFNDAVVKMKEFLQDEGFGELYYLHSRRNNLGPIREDVSAVWDLVPHDVSIFRFLLDAEPETVSAMGGCFLKPDRADAAFINMTFPNHVVANIQASWVDSNKIREVVAIGSKMRVVFNDLDNLERIKIFKKGISAQRDINGFGEFQYLLRDGEIVSPKLELREPLKNLAEHFLNCVESGEKPLSGGDDGQAIVMVLEAIEQSMRNNGAPVAIPSQNLSEDL
ncbi:MAG: Gfo/Idh/MocA family oxidoreductase [Planctomycetes bacterium]|nr:Gfo/Idh/MocA family oxidoreductase [Planctomycetota bacterium]